MHRLLFIFASLASLGFSQNVPAFQWIKQVDTSGSDSVAGIGVDAAGSTYIAGSTTSPNYPVKAAAQNHIASSGLYLITGAGAAYSALGLGAAFFVAVDPLNANTIYAASTGSLLRSTNGGASFTPLTLPSSSILNVAINPDNDQILYAGTYDQGLLKSTDGGATWTTANGSLQATSPQQFEFEYLWIDSTSPNVLLATAAAGLIQSSDGGGTWQTVLPGADIVTVSFDSTVPDLVYAADQQGNVSVSTNHGQSFTSLATPVPFETVFPDPTQSGRLIGLGQNAIYVSTDSGSSWTLALTLPFAVNPSISAADWTHGLLYVASASKIVRITADLKTSTPAGPPVEGLIVSLAAANGVAYVANTGSHDVYVTKLDPSGNIVYSTYFGGSSDDLAVAMTADASGDVYVTGATDSLDFPVTKGAYASTGSSFLFKLNPDGSVAYSTYGPSGALPSAIAVDAYGAAFIAGTSNGGLTTTPGVYQPTCSYCGITSNGFFGVINNSGFGLKFDSTGSTLLYSTYVGPPVQLGGNLITTLAPASDGTAYFAGADGIIHLNAAASAVLGTAEPAAFTVQSLAIAPDGSVYAAGSANGFPTIPGAFQPNYTVITSLLDYQSGNLPAEVIARWDSGLANILNATYFGPGKSANAMVFDPAGNVYIGGGTAQRGLPTRTPLQLGFAPSTGFVSELSGDLSTLLFSSYFGDTENFAVQGLGIRKDGSVVLGGLASVPNYTDTAPFNPGTFNPWVNSLALALPPALRVDSVVNAASLLDGPISVGETVIVQGAGFTANAQLSIGGIAVPAISQTSTSIVAAVPSNVTIGAAEVQVTSGSSSSNQVLVQVTPTAPGIFSQNGSGFGQGYILNKDGTLNTPSNPAHPGDPISVFATGVGPVSVTQGYALSQYPVNVYIEGIFANGIEAFLNPVPGLPGNVYDIQVYVPDPAALVSANPNLQNFVYPALTGVEITVNGVQSQPGIAISISTP